MRSLIKIVDTRCRSSFSQVFISSVQTLHPQVSTHAELIFHHEAPLVKHHSMEHKRLSEYTYRLCALHVGCLVCIQNLTGNYPLTMLTWELMRTIVEVKQHHQYVVWVDCSGWVTLHSKEHRCFTPCCIIPKHGITSPIACEGTSHPGSSEQARHS